jgi:hypothetical protein
MNPGLTIRGLKVGESLGEARSVGVLRLRCAQNDRVWAGREMSVVEGLDRVARSTWF